MTKNKKVEATDNKGAKERLKEKLGRYKKIKKARRWLDQNNIRVKIIFENYRLRDFVLEPFKAVFDSPKKTIDNDIYSVITQVAVINAVLAGLPGKMGVGVYVSMALEGWMAFQIARHIGIRMVSPRDVWKYFGLLAATLGTIFYLFRALLGLGFSVFSMVIPFVNPLIFAELLVTDFIGVLFRVGFLEVQKNNSFAIPIRMTTTMVPRQKRKGFLVEICETEIIRIYSVFPNNFTNHYFTLSFPATDHFME